MNTIERFWSKVNRNGQNFPGHGNCWEWTGTNNGLGYGKFQIDGKRVYAHRFSYELLVGKIPDGLELDHLCRNPSCVNPSHLEPVDHRENLLRGAGVSAVNASKTHCPLGHPLSGENLTVKKNGYRRCKECHRISARKYLLSRRDSVNFKKRAQYEQKKDEINAIRRLKRSLNKLARLLQAQ